MHRYRWRRDRSCGRAKPMKDTKRTAPLAVSLRGEFGRASSRGWPVDRDRNCRISLAELRNVEKERAREERTRRAVILYLWEILKAGDNVARLSSVDKHRELVTVKRWKGTRSTRRSCIYLNQREILGAFHLFRERTKNVSHSLDERSERLT